MGRRQTRERTRASNCETRRQASLGFDKYMEQAKRIMTDKVSGLDSRLVDTASTAVHDGSSIGGVPGKQREEARATRNISRPGAREVPGGPGHLVGVCGEKASSASTWGTRMDQWPGLTLRQDGRTTQCSTYEVGGISDGSKGATSNGACCRQVATLEDVGLETCAWLV